MKVVAAIIVATTLSACAGTPFKWSEARNIKEGMTTQEVTAIMGAPYSATAVDGLLRYIWVDVSMLNYSTKTLLVDFKDGKVTKAPPIPAEFQ
jgi:hypothetical protein